MGDARLAPSLVLHGGVQGLRAGKASEASQLASNTYKIGCLKLWTWTDIRPTHNTNQELHNAQLRPYLVPGTIKE